MKLFIRMDWAEEVIVLENSLNELLKDNYGLDFRLSIAQNYDDEATISYDGVQEAYSKALCEQGLILSNIDSQSDDYIFVLYKDKDGERVEEAIRIIEDGIN